MSSETFHSRLSAAHIRTAQEQSHAIWGDGRSLEARIEKLHRLLAAPGSILWASGLTVGGQLVASMKRYHFKMKIGKALVPTLGVGAVFTSPAHRGRGYAARLLKSVMGEERAAGTQAALLYSAIRPSYYEALGYGAISSQRWKCEIAKISEADALEWRPEREGDWKTFERIRPASDAAIFYDDHTRPFFRQLNVPEQSFVSFSGTNLQAYVSYVVSAGALFLEEYGFDSRFERSFWSELRKMAERSGCHSIAGWVGAAPLPTGTTISNREDKLAMVAMLSSSNTLTPASIAHLQPIDFF